MRQARHGGDIYAYQEQFGHVPLDFSANINPLGMPPAAKRAAMQAAAGAVHYPDPQSMALRARLAQREKVQKEWLIFLAQFEEEIKGGTNVVIKENRIHYEKKEKDFIVEQYQNMIRKREKAGGHQPMLTQVKKWEVRDSAVAIILLVEFENGEKNEGIWTKSFT